MTRWKLQDNIVCMRGTVQCATAEDGDEAEFICDAHNAECAAYEKQIAEMQRRIDALECELYGIRTQAERENEWRLTL